MDILQELTQILKDRNISNNPITPNQDLVKDLAMDSLDVMDTITDVEDRFNITITDKDLNYLRTIGDFIKIIEKKIQT